MRVLSFRPLARGQYDAQVQDSWIASWYSYLGRRPKLYRALRADVELCKNGRLVCGMTVNFFIHQEGRKSRRELEALQSLASAAGVDQLEDSDQLHGKRFRLIVWSGENITFRPAP